MPFPARALNALKLPPDLHELVARSARVLKGWGWADQLSSGLYRQGDEMLLEIAGVWRLTVGMSGAHVERRGLAGTWEPVRLGSIALGESSDEDDGDDEDKAMPFLRLWPRRSPGEWLDALWPQALEEALIEAVTGLEAAGSPISDVLIEAARGHLQALWFEPGGVVKAAKLVEQARELRYRVESLFGEPKFLARVRAVRRGFPVGLGHVLQAWGRRHALHLVAVANPAWLPLLNVIALRHWDSTGWRTPDGWLRRQAVVWDRHGEPRLPWGEGLCWHPTELPVFTSKVRAKAWLSRGKSEACVGVWGSAENVEALEKDLARWSKRIDWPKKAVTPAMMAELQRMHKEMTDHLLCPPPEQLLDEAVMAWLERSIEAWKPAGFEGWALVRGRLAAEWGQLVEELRHVPRGFEGSLDDLGSVHPWTMRLRQENLERALPTSVEAAPRERF